MTAPPPPPWGAKFQRSPSVTAEMVQARLGKAGRVSIANSIGNRWVPNDLYDTYLRQFSASGGFPSSSSRSPKLPRHILQAVRRDASGFRMTQKAATATTFLRYKKKIKCRLLLNAVRINAADSRCPPRIHLPSLGTIAGRLGGPKGQGLWMAKLDLIDTYWSIHLPGKWRHVFIVRAGAHGWRYTRLPFGWKYSPAICQRLVAALVRSATRGLDVSTDVYLDDILVLAASPRVVCIAVDRIVSKLQGAGFITSLKSETKPAQRMIFIGKCIDARKSTISNSQEAVAVVLRIWLQGLGQGGGSPRTSSRGFTAGCNGLRGRRWAALRSWRVPIGTCKRGAHTSPEGLPGHLPLPLCALHHLTTCTGRHTRASKQFLVTRPKSQEVSGRGWWGGGGLLPHPGLPFVDLLPAAGRSIH